MKDKTGRPNLVARAPYTDLDSRSIHIPEQLITVSMLAPNARPPVPPGVITTKLYGYFGRSLYGRCIYGEYTLTGIYGTDKYDKCVYG